MKVSTGSIIFSIILLAGSTFIIPDSFAENLFYGKATFERVPDLIVPQKPETFEIKFQYTEGPYVLQNLTAIFQTSPRSAINFVHINSETVEVNPISIARIPVNITVDEKIRQEKIFLSVTYEGMGLHGIPFKSAWADSIILDISPKDLKGFALDDCSPTNLKSETNDGSVLITCHNINSNSIMAIVNSLSNSTLSLEIPKSMVYSLMSTDCETSNDFFVLVNGEEVEFDVNERVDTNQVIVNVPKGNSEVEIIGTTIIPLSSPAQYCGIVEGYDKQYLPPHKQFKNEVEIKFIRCNEGLVFIQKNNDTPACVKPSTIPKLIERGWGK